MRGSIKASNFNLFLVLFLLLSFRPSSATTRSPGRNPRQLAHSAVAISASRAREAAAYVSRLSLESPQSHRPSPFKDCAGMMAHSAERLQWSVVEMRSLGRAGSPQYRLRASNVKTWVSSALTDQEMCLYSLSTAAGSKLKEAVKGKVTGVRQATSNALSLVNRMN